MEEIEGDKYIQVDEKTIILQSNSSEMPTRLTPTGKISYAKTRVYTQRYRKEWELMSDFKGWLTSVAHEPTRAFCKYCKKDLHAHRLSLLKHMCTMKHQRSALMYHNAMVARRKDARNTVGVDEGDYSENEDTREEQEQEEEEEEEEEVEESVEYAFEEMDTEEETNFPEHKYARDVSEEEEDQKIQIKTIKLEITDRKRDKLAEAMAHVHGEVSEENMEHVQLDMDVVSETVETSEFSEEITEPLSESQNLSLVSLESTDADPQNDEDHCSETEEITQEIEFVDSTIVKPTSLKKRTVPISNTITISPNNNKTIVLTSGGKAMTLASGKVTSGTQYVFSKLKGKTSIITENKSPLISIAPKSIENQSSHHEEAGTSQAKRMIKITKPPTNFIKKPTISTHVLDTGKGLPIGGLQVSLYKLLDGRWTFVNECNTSTAGRCSDLMDSDKNSLTTGRYKLHFDVDKYFSLRKIETLYPFIEIVFDVKNPVISYHIPILLSPFGYTTYRGMDR